ncbi:MAG: hypothetical protein Kow00127_00840 [Bacteroidales bacterium]
MKQVKNNPDAGRFELKEGDFTAYIEYKIKDNKYYLISTQVPEELSGQGIGSRLLKGSLELIEKSGYKVVPVCSFVSGWFERHPGKSELLA